MADYATEATTDRETTPPDLAYRPQDPTEYDPGIGLIGCGGVTGAHLTAYRKAGYDVRALCDVDESAAEARREEFYPDVDVYTDHEALLARDDIAVVDVPTGPGPRPTLIADAIRAGKHVLSQKPFVLDLDTGERLADLADEHGVKLAVNQNGRWAPQFADLREAVAAGHLGQPQSVDFTIHWNHVETGTRHLLFDFAIHQFDLIACLFPDRTPTSVSAHAAQAPARADDPPALVSMTVEYDDALATMTLDAGARHGGTDRTVVVGTEGTFVSSGPERPRAANDPAPRWPWDEQTVSLHTDAGTATPALEGSWNPDGWHGAMAELLSAIAEDREPVHAGRDNLRSLELCYAAVESAERGAPVDPSDVDGLPEAE
jgi:predicted dehydrogenase